MASQVGVYLVVATCLFPASVFVGRIPTPAQTFLLVTGGLWEIPETCVFFNFHLK